MRVIGMGAGRSLRLLGRVIHYLDTKKVCGREAVRTSQSVSGLMDNSVYNFFALGEPVLSVS
jgi:hypothetical protein